MSILRGIDHFGKLSLRSILRENIIAKISQSLIDAGGYYNLPTGTYGYEGHDLSRLRASYRPEYSNFKFWAGNSSNWVWESQNPTYTGGVAPLIPTGIWISGTFYGERSGGIYDHYIDFARGGVVFTNPQPSGLTVYCPHSERAAFVYSSTGPEYRRLFNAHLRNWQETSPGSGYDEISQDLKTFLPAIFIDIKRSYGIPYELGSSVRMDSYTVAFDVMAEDIISYDFLMDVCTSIQTETIKGYDSNPIRTSGFYGLNYDGSLNPNRLSFDQRSAQYFWKNIKFKEDAMETDSYLALPVIRASITVDLEIFV